MPSILPARRKRYSPMKLEHAALQLKTCEGLPLAVGGICRPGTGTHWTKKFERLRSLRFDGCDIYQTDLVIAQAIQALSDRSLLIAGCTVCTGMKLPDGASSGGVLGSPFEEIRSASEEAELLPEGFAMYTAPGGPGIAAQASPAAVRQTGMALRKLGRRISDEALMPLLYNSGFEAGIVVYDGIGPGVCGRLICWGVFGWSSLRLPGQGDDAR